MLGWCESASCAVLRRASLGQKRLHWRGVSRRELIGERSVVDLYGLIVGILCQDFTYKVLESRLIVCLAADQQQGT
jgi:hypothetical protein